MIGTGEIATPSASGRTSPITPPMPTPPSASWLSSPRLAVRGPGGPTLAGGGAASGHGADQLPVDDPPGAQPPQPTAEAGALHAAEGQLDALGADTVDEDHAGV